MKRRPPSGWSSQGRRSRHLASPPCSQPLIWTLSISANPRLYATPHPTAFTAHADQETPALTFLLHSRKPSRNVKALRSLSHTGAVSPPFSAALYTQRSNYRGPTPAPGSKTPQTSRGWGVGDTDVGRLLPTRTEHKLMISEGVRPVALPKVWSLQLKNGT